MKKCFWTIFKNNFINIIHDNETYERTFNFVLNTDNNVLFYGHYGFPIDLLMDEILKSKFNITNLYKQECSWNKDITYLYNQHFLEIDLMHPSLSKNFANLTKFIISIIKNKNIGNDRHCIIIKHIDMLSQNDYSSFRIMLERYSCNAYFFCTTHKLDKIDVPVKSRFALLRIPLLSHQDILNIFSLYLEFPLNEHLVQAQTRDIIKAIFIAQIEYNDKSVINKEFCTLNFPPICEFVQKFDKRKNNLDAIRKFSYKCFQYNISIPALTHDLLKILPNKSKANLIEIASKTDHQLNLTKKGREPLYIEAFLCNVLL